MRCLSCNKQLNDKEATRKYASTGDFIDLCDGCFRHVEEDIPSIGGYEEEDCESGYDNGED